MSGSSNTHAKKAPSASKRWLSCSASIIDTENHQDEITAQSAEQIIELAPYITGLPKEEQHKDELHAINLARRIKQGKITIDELDEDQADLLQSNSGSVYSREGTRAHDFGERILNGEISIEDIPADFQQPVGVYVDECRRLQGEYPHFEPMIEEKAKLFYDPTSTGTVDFAVVSEDLVTILDLKYGQGVLVEVEWNTQLLIYGVSLIEELIEDGLYTFHNGTVLTIGICQPRHHGAAPIRYWSITWGELQEWIAEVKQAVADIDAGEAVYAPSEDVCRWCPLPVKSRCKARQESLSADLSDDDFRASLDALPDLKPRSKAAKEFKAKSPEERIRVYEEGMGQLSLEFLVHLHGKRKEWNLFLDDIGTYLFELASSGNPADGTKMVMGREGNRAWTDEVEAEKLLENQKYRKDDRTTSKVITPTAAEKLLHDKLDPKSEHYSPRLAKAFEALVYRSPAQPVLAMADDKRPSIASAVDLLDDLDDEGLGEESGPTDIK